MRGKIASSGVLATARARRMRARLYSLGKAVPGAQRLLSGLDHGVMSIVAALGAYLPTRALGLHEGFWAAITAITVVQTEYHATQTTARDQLAGAAVGGVIAVAVLTLAGPGLAGYACAVVAAIVTAWALNIASAARLAGTTATILMLVPHQGVTPQAMMIARVGEVGWGVCVAVAVVWLFGRAGALARRLIRAYASPSP